MKRTTFYYYHGVTRVVDGPLPVPLPPVLAGPDFVRMEETDVPDPQPDPNLVWAEKLSGRITDPVTGIQIEAREKTKDLLTSTVVFLTTAVSRNVLSGTSPYSLWDADGDEHKLTVDEVLDVLLRYGIQWSQMYVEFAP